MKILDRYLSNLVFKKQAILETICALFSVTQTMGV